MENLPRLKVTLPNPSLSREGLIVSETLNYLFSVKILNEKSLLSISPSLFKRRVGMSSNY